MMSSTSSIPTLTRIKSGVLPFSLASSGVSCRCVVLCGCRTSVRTSPTLGAWMASWVASMKARAMAVDERDEVGLSAKQSMPPLPRGRKRLKRACEG